MAWSSLVVQDLSTLGGIPPKVIRARAMSFRPSTKGSNAIELRSISSLAQGFWFLKQSFQRGVAVDSWTLCVRGEWRRAGG